MVLYITQSWQVVIAIGHNRRRARSSSFTTPSDSSSGNYGAGRTLVVSLLQLHFFFRICFMIYIKPYRYLAIRTFGLWTSGHPDFRLLTIRTSDFQTLDFWPSEFWTTDFRLLALQTSGHLNYLIFELPAIQTSGHLALYPNVLKMS